LASRHAVVKGVVVSVRWFLPLLCSFLALAGASVAEATAPGAAGRIVFSSDRTGNLELYSVGADGGSERRLTWTAASEQSPAWSPDGQRIAFERGDASGSRIWAALADGSGEVELSPSAGESVDDRDPAWSPDGSRIAFSSTRTGTWNLWLMNADGTGLRKLSDAFASDPAWSPDGHELAYVGIDGIGVIHADTGSTRLVSATGAFASGPSWSPDGRRIVFARNNMQGYPGELHLVNADGSGEQQLTNDGFQHARPSWSPDGTEIVFQRTASAPFGWELWAISSDGLDERQLTARNNDLGPDWGSSQVVPEPSPPDAPMIEIYSPEEGGVYLPEMQVEAFFLCSSAVSFVVSCEGDAALGEPVDLSSAGTHTFTVRATDLDGRTATRTVTFEVLDIVAPTIELRAPRQGASYSLGEELSVDYSCLDTNGSGVAICGGDLPTGAPLDTRQAGSHTFHAYAVDNAGNIRETTVTYDVLDHSPPLIDISAPSDGAQYELGATVNAHYSCRSATGVHLLSCEGSVPSGTAIDTGSIGTKTFAVNAGNEDGGTATLTRTYRVIYAFGGFDAPVDANGTIENAKAGDAIPLKFSLAGDHGLNVVAATSSQPASCADWSDLGPREIGNGKLSYSSTSDRYRYLIATERSWKNSCRTIELALADGTRHKLRVRFVN
jgi:hypothetical protein